MPSVSRRHFLKNSLLLASTSTLLPRLLSTAYAGPQQSYSEDEKVVRQKFELARKESLQNKPIGDVMRVIGMSFLGTPYAAHILEEPGEEHLVINLRGLDCVSFAENTLALSRCVKMGKTSYDEFTRQLQLIRYRNGNINHYPSRLHYFSDWIDDNVKKGIVRNATKSIGGRRYQKLINYMTTHRSEYPQLSNEAFYGEILEMEKSLTGRLHYYVAKGKLIPLQKKIHTGDIVAITSALPGMDIAHTGLAIHEDGVVRLLHAPIVGSQVQITEKSLVDYLASHSKQTGIMVARPLEPQPSGD